MHIINIIDEDIINYKEISMFIGLPYCSGKCWKDLGLPADICQNECLRKSKILNIDNDIIIQRFLDNELTTAIVFGGLEPFDSNEELQCFIMNFRRQHDNTIVIYTGYTEEEVKEKFNWIYLYENIIIKYGRYRPNQKPHYDEVLGVNLISDNQYAKAYNMGIAT